MVVGTWEQALIGIAKFLIGETGWESRPA